MKKSKGKNKQRLVKDKRSNESTSKLSDAQVLRNKAELIVHQKNANIPENFEILNYDETLKIIHELQVHQIELEMQNEELHRIQQALTTEKQRYFNLYNLAPVGYCTLSAENLIIEANLIAANLFGMSQSELAQQPITRFIHPEDQDLYYLSRKKILNTQEQQSFELRLQSQNSADLWVYVVASIETTNGENREIRLVLTDISDRKLYESELNRIAKYDALTKLPNRTLLSDRLYQSMAHALRHKKPMAVLYIDLDNFKEINVDYSYEIGDQVLIRLAERMKKGIRNEDTISRFEGDEFVAILLDLTSVEYAIPKINHLSKIISQPIHIGDLTLQVTASIGISFYPQKEPVDTEMLLRQANQAMYHAKLSGRDKYHLFNTQNEDTLRYKYKFIAGMDQALKASEFDLHYQPKVNIKTGKVLGVEALIRWHHPTKGLLTPAEFLPIIADNPFSIELGNWVLETALRQMELWLAQGIELKVSANIDLFQLKEDNFVTNLQSVLEKHPTINPENIGFEILESSQLNELEVTSNIIKKCQTFGISFALDHFGTGCSSLTYLQKLPVNCIKMDQSFIKDLHKNTDNQAILKGIINLANALKLEVIVEGIETIEHGELLIKMGCLQAQGGAIAYPMPADELPAWLETWQTPSFWHNLTP